MSMTVSPESVRFEDDALWVTLSDGRTLGVPLAWFPRLRHATPEARAAVTLSPIGLHWEALDEDISVSGLLARLGEIGRVGKVASVQGDLPLSSIQAQRNSIIRALFVETADHNYIVARWSFFHSLHRDFFWNALHALEKYLKAALVLNGISVKESDHNIEALFDELSRICPEMLPSALIPPNEIGDTSLWRSEPSYSFIRRLHMYGHPDNRYAYFSIVVQPAELFKLDALVFSIRRVTIGLDWGYLEHPKLGAITYRQRLLHDWDFQPNGRITPPKIRDPKRQEELDETLHRLNFAFRRHHSDLCGTWPGTSAKNSWLYLLAAGAYSDPSQKSALKAHTLQWPLDNIRFRKPTRRELEDAIRKLTP